MDEIINRPINGPINIDSKNTEIQDNILFSFTNKELNGPINRP
jgi:hypothetical protein